MTRLSSPTTRRTSTWLVAPLLAAVTLVACARSNFDPDDTPAGGTAGAAGSAAGTGGTAGGTGGTASGAAGSTAGSAGTAAGSAGTGGSGGASGKGGSSGKGGTTGKGGGTAGGCRLVINEVCMQGCSGSDKPNDEFIELFNGGDGPCDVEGWILQYRSDSNSGSGTPIWTGESGDTIEAGGLLLVAGTDFGGKSDVTYPGTLSKDGGGVGLKNAGETLVDAVAYGTAKDDNDFCEGKPAPKVSPGSSVARTNDGKDTEDNSADFSDASPTPGEVN